MGRGLGKIFRCSPGPFLPLASGCVLRTCRQEVLQGSDAVDSPRWTHASLRPACRCRSSPLLMFPIRMMFGVLHDESFTFPASRAVAGCGTPAFNSRPIHHRSQWLYQCRCLSIPNPAHITAIAKAMLSKCCDPALQERAARLGAPQRSATLPAARARTRRMMTSSLRLAQPHAR